MTTVPPVLVDLVATRLTAALVADILTRSFTTTTGHSSLHASTALNYVTLALNTVEAIDSAIDRYVTVGGPLSAPKAFPSLVVTGSPAYSPAALRRRATVEAETVEALRRCTALRLASDVSRMKLRISQMRMLETTLREAAGDSNRDPATVESWLKTGEAQYPMSKIWADIIAATPVSQALGSGGGATVAVKDGGYSSTVVAAGAMVTVLAVAAAMLVSRLRRRQQQAEATEEGYGAAAL